MRLIQRVLMLLVMMIANVDAATVSGFIAPVYCNASDPLNLNGAGGIDIIFVNGIDNTPEDAIQTEGSIMAKIVRPIKERLLTGRWVVIVAHSQGNHFIEAAYAILQNRMTPEQLAGLQVVGVAVVASTTPHNRWVTIAQDKAVYFAYTELTVGSPLGNNNNPKGNFNAVANKNGEWGTSEPSDWNLLTWDVNGHNMVNIYLNDQIFRKSDHAMTLLAEVARLVKDGVDNTTAPAQIVTAGSLTATLTWINQTDLDLHIIEVFNDGSSDTHVSYRNQQGRSGKLDRDDTSGPGPEYYYANVNDSSGNLCAALHGKTFRFSVNPFKTLNMEEPTVLNLRIGNTIYSKSLLLTNADRTIDRLPTSEASFADATVAGRAIFDVTFDYANGYRVVDY